MGKTEQVISLANWTPIKFVQVKIKRYALPTGGNEERIRNETWIRQNWFGTKTRKGH